MLARAATFGRPPLRFLFGAAFRFALRLGLVFPAVLILACLPTWAHQPKVSTQRDHFRGNPESELQAGTDLTREGKFAEAIPHLLAAKGHVADAYAANFNLALCYVATGQPQLALPILEPLQTEKSTISAVWNLSAQAYVGAGQPEKALRALQRAAQIAPRDERLYSYVADACTATRDNALGLEVVDLGLRNVPRSPRLHYERAVFLTGLDRFAEAKKDFQLAGDVGRGTDIGYLAAVHESLIEGDFPASIREARDAISKGKDNYILLSLYAEALFRSGVYSGSPSLTEAERAAEKSIAQRPDYAASRITLGKLYRIDHRVDDSITQLEAARKLDPHNPAVYSNLATAYGLKGDHAKADEALAVLERLNQEQVVAIRTSGTKTGERRGNVSAVQNQ